MNTAMDTKEKVASSNQTSTSAGQDKSAAATPNEHCGSVSFSQMDGKENVPNKNKNTEKEAKDQSSESHTKKKRKTTNADQDDGYTSSSLLLCLKKNKSYKKQKKCDGDKVSCIISDSASQDNSSNKDFRPDDRSAQQMEGLTSEPSSDLKCESSSGIWASFKSLAMSRSKVQKSKEQNINSEANSCIERDDQDSSVKHSGSKAKISLFKKCQKGQKKSAAQSAADDACGSLQVKQVMPNQNEAEVIHHEMKPTLLESDRADGQKNRDMGSSSPDAPETRAEEKGADSSQTRIQSDQDINANQSQNVEPMISNEDSEEADNQYPDTEEVRGPGKFQRVKEKSIKKVFCVNAFQHTIKKVSGMQNDEENLDSEVNKKTDVMCITTDDRQAYSKCDETMKNSESLKNKERNDKCHET
ncbi:uncharacterized protein LOC122804488 [Protopterus annectens]|uniref:uncharacterized protein LOC122804488 n=1 Tax=Protopterus annectens TaxID=7888 RepID=UPI001CFAC3D9|nr:uncharacterized protein LOC122804488 [Protopterus annectens]